MSHEKVSDRLARVKSIYICEECGFEARKWAGRCPGCEAWNTMTEAEPVEIAPGPGPMEQPRSLDEPFSENPRFTTGLAEFDRVLGGGVVPGSLVLIGGEPGVGKSTLLLQMAASFARLHGTVLYVSGEESFRQLRLRAGRLGVQVSEVKAVNETNILNVIAQAQELQPKLLILDSIQTMSHPERPGFPGGVSQVRDCTAVLLNWAKNRHVPCLMVGHITKSGGLAGPKVMEHMVDVVLYFEGDHYYSQRLLRAAKNRFGATHEMALFNMGDHGLTEVANPSGAFLAERHPGRSGTVVTAAMEGSMPLLVEVQALVAPAGYASSRRLVTGLDPGRVGMILAVLERRGGMFLSDQDVYASAIGGVRLNEPAVDLGIALAVASSLRDEPLTQDLVAFGEVGLTGEIRRVSSGQRRLEEAAHMGFRRAILPKSLSQELKQAFAGMNLVGVNTIAEALSEVWD
jgi:DNA repair protein RadA/Sms